MQIICLIMHICCSHFYCSHLTEALSFSDHSTERQTSASLPVISSRTRSSSYPYPRKHYEPFPVDVGENKSYYISRHCVEEQLVLGYLQGEGGVAAIRKGLVPGIEVDLPKALRSKSQASPSTQGSFNHRWGMEAAPSSSAFLLLVELHTELPGAADGILSQQPPGQRSCRH